MKHMAKDSGSTNVESSAAEELAEKKMGTEEAKEPPTESELDMHHDTLMKAEKIKGDAHIMKHLKPHMAMKLKHMKGVMGKAEKAEPIKSIDGLKEKYKSMP